MGQRSRVPPARSTRVGATAVTLYITECLRWICAKINIAFRGIIISVAVDYLFKNRRMRVCSWAATPGFASAATAAFDQQLRQFIQLELIKIKSLDDSEVHPADLLIISAEGLDDELFPEWIKGISARILGG